MLRQAIIHITEVVSVVALNSNNEHKEKRLGLLGSKDGG